MTKIYLKLSETVKVITATILIVTAIAIAAFNILDNRVNQPQQWIYILMVCCVALFFNISAFISINKTVRQILRSLNAISNGENTYRSTGNKKIDNLFETITLRYNSFVEISKKLKKGNLNIDKYSKDTNHKLYKNLLKIRKNLLRNEKENKKYQNESLKRNWLVSGQALFTDLLHKNKGNVEELAEHVLTELIKYLKAGVGVFYIYSNNDDSLNPLSTYAHNRRKFNDTVIKTGEGLVGACAYERDTIYMSDVPANYTKIKSGTGESLPRSLIIVPLIAENELIGVIEIASLNVFKQIEIEFCETIAENIAITIYNMNINKKTKLLLEESEFQKSELSEQEEELRQNMEELRTTQEEMSRKNDELTAHQDLLNTIIDMIPFPVFVKNNNREYIFANKEQGKLFSLGAQQIIGCRDEDFITDTLEINEIWKSDGKVLKNEKLVLPEQVLTMKDGTKKILQTTKIPFINNKTKNINILGISLDLSDKRYMEKKQQKYKQEIAHLKNMIEHKKVFAD